MTEPERVHCGMICAAPECRHRFMHDRGPECAGHWCPEVGRTVSCRRMGALQLDPIIRLEANRPCRQPEK